MTTPPKISIVTPSFNQNAFLERAISSVLDQDYPNLEYVFVDGGSTDGSNQTIARYRERLAGWVVESDNGQYDAINKGFARSTGEIMAWLNASDAYFPDAFSIVAEIFDRFPQIEWLTSRIVAMLDEQGRCVFQDVHPGYERTAFLRGENLCAPGWYSTGFVPQESTFWRRSLWERAGSKLDTRYSYAADFELWARFFRHAPLYATSSPLGLFRKHTGQISGEKYDAYVTECQQILKCQGGRPRGRLSSIPPVLLRRHLPPRLRGIAHRLGLLRPALICDFDFQISTWKIRPY